MAQLKTFFQKYNWTIFRYLVNTLSIIWSASIAHELYVGLAASKDATYLRILTVILVAFYLQAVWISRVDMPAKKAAKL